MQDPDAADPERAGARPPDAAQHRMPRWVVGFVVAGLVVLVVLALALALGGDHGPQRHRVDDQDRPARTTEDHTPPVEHP